MAPKMQEFECTYEERPGYMVVHVKGAFGARNLRAARDFINELLITDARTIIFELAGVTFMDSSAVGLVLGVHKKCKQRGGTSGLVTIPAPLQGPLTTAGIFDSLPHFSDLQDADMRLRVPVETEEHGSFLVIRIQGSFSLPIVASLRAIIEESQAIGHRNLVFDLSQVNHISSVGIGLILNVHKQLIQKEGCASLACVPPAVRETLTTSGLLSLLPVYDSLEAAEAAII